MRLRRLLVATAAMLIGAGGVVQAQSLRESLASAYSNNPDLGAARASLNATDELVSQALSGYRPQVGVSAGYTYDHINSNVGDFDLNTKSVGVNVSQPLYRGGGLDANLRSSENTVRASRANLIATEQQILYNAVQAYSNVWRDRSVLDLAINNERRLERQLRATRDRFNVGELARTDVAQAEARLSGGVADRVAAEGALAASVATFRSVIALEPTKVQQPPVAPELPASERESQELAAANPNIAAAQHVLAAARDDVDVAFASLLPSVDLTASASYADEPSSSLAWAQDTSIGIQVTVPLYQGGAEYSRVRQNKQIVRQRDQQLVSAQRSVSEQVTTAWESLQSATQNIRSRQSQVRANSIALEGVTQEQQVGSRTVLDVLDAEQELFSSQVELVRAQATEAVASYALLAAVGQLTADRLKLDVVPFDAEAYYRENRSRLFGLGDPLQ